jgi:hypothetical protein
MEFSTFKSSLARTTPPSGLSKAAEALWWDGKDDWTQAHECAQAQDDKQGAWVHAYLHRKEGDLSNAGYWYRRAGKKAAEVPLPVEWEAIARALLKE